jgi:hypothetical protein
MDEKVDVGARAGPSSGDGAEDADISEPSRLMVDAADLLGVDVDVVSDRGTGPAIDHIRAEAVAL